MLLLYGLLDECQGFLGKEDRMGLGNHNRHLDEPLATLDLMAELAQLHAEEPWQHAGRQAKTLIKADDLRVVLIAMHPEAHLAAHHAPGRITIQVLAGAITVQVAERRVELGVGQVLTLGAGVVHDVKAREESAFLLTIAWPH
jgi:quercetin dioxygenase-like cupin family protein